MINLHGYGPSILEGTLLTIAVSFYSVVAFNYLIVTSVAVYLLPWLETRYSAGVKKA